MDADKAQSGMSERIRREQERRVTRDEAARLELEQENLTLKATIEQLQQQVEELQTAIRCIVEVEKTKPVNTDNLPKVLFTPLANLELSVRAYNCLTKGANDLGLGAKYVGDVVIRTEAELLRIPNFGRKSLIEVKELLGPLGLYPGMEFPNWVPSNVETDVNVKAQMSN